MKILLVDDDVSSSFFAYQVLSREGYECITALTIDGGKAVLDSEDHIDLVLCDLYFSGIPAGIEFMDWIRENSPDSVSMIYTQMSENDVNWNDSFLSKNLSPKELIESVNKLISNS